MHTDLHGCIHDQCRHMHAYMYLHEMMHTDTHTHTHTHTHMYVICTQINTCMCARTHTHTHTHTHARTHHKLTNQGMCNTSIALYFIVLYSTRECLKLTSNGWVMLTEMIMVVKYNTCLHASCFLSYLMCCRTLPLFQTTAKSNSVVWFGVVLFVCFFVLFCFFAMDWSASSGIN